MPSILLVEDDPLLIDIYTRKFRKSGFTVEVANSGDKALEMVRTGKYELLILDIVLPQKGGFEVLREIRADSKFSDLKIVILSNLGQKEEVDKGIALGATKYLIKAHYTPSQVVEEIEKILK